MLLKNACKNHQTYVRKTDDNCPKMVPKPLQNRSWRGSGSLLGATLETRCFQDLIFDDFDSILEPPLGPVWAHFGYNVFDVFLKWLFDGLGLHLASQNTSKMRPKRGPKPRPENHRFWCHLPHFGHIQGAENHIFFMFFGTLFLGRLLDPMLVISALFWGPFWRQFVILLGYRFCIDF